MHIGTIVSDTNGSLVLTSVAKGCYGFVVTPPAGSRYKPATFGGEAFENSDMQSTAVYLQAE
jgi:hypothetical protein